MTYDPTFESPGSLECLKKVKELSEVNWSMYVGPDGSVTPGHMLPYPFKVEKDGRLLPLDEQDMPHGGSEHASTLAERIFGSIHKAGVVMSNIGFEPHVLTT